MSGQFSIDDDDENELLGTPAPALAPSTTLSAAATTAASARAASNAAAAAAAAIASGTEMSAEEEEALLLGESAPSSKPSTPAAAAAAAPAATTTTNAVAVHDGEADVEAVDEEAPAETPEQRAAWVEKLQETLSAKPSPDTETLRLLCTGHRIPHECRAAVWKFLLGVDRKPDPLKGWAEPFDLENQSVLHDDCLRISGNNDAVAADMEKIITCFCKARGVDYKPDRQWATLVHPLLATGLPAGVAYNCFYALLSMFVPRQCEPNGLPFHVLRELVLYHDPEVCVMLDSRKITMEQFCLPWFRSLFASACDTNVIMQVWDVYFITTDPFLILFLALVILLNFREPILAAKTKEELLELLPSIPSQLTAEDVPDFCELARFYATLTPQTFFKDNFALLFRESATSTSSNGAPLSPAGPRSAAASQSARQQKLASLCLTVSPTEVYQQVRGQASSSGAKADRAPTTAGGQSIVFYVIDCRPVEQFNAGRFPQSMHLDPYLLLNDPAKFAQSVKELNPHGESDHISFFGTGNEEEDLYMRMVVSYFLQRAYKCISIIDGGYAAYHKLMEKGLVEIEGHSDALCEICQEKRKEADAAATSPGALSTFGAKLSLFGSKLREKSKTMDLKGKLMSKLRSFDDGGAAAAEPAEGSDAAENDVPRTPTRREASSSTGSDLFTIGDEGDDDGQATSRGKPRPAAQRRGRANDSPELPDADEATLPCVNLDDWVQKPDIVQIFPCNEIRNSGEMRPSYLVLTTDNLIKLSARPDKHGWAYLRAQHSLLHVTKITAKKKHPNLIGFVVREPPAESKPDSSDNAEEAPEEEEIAVKCIERFLIPEAQTCTKIVTKQIMALRA